MTPQWIEFPVHADPRGVLIAIEGGRDLPFEIRRVFTMSGMPAGSVRGAHAHRRQRQVVLCQAGACTLSLDDGRERRVERLARGPRGLVLEPGVWHELRDFSADCVLLVLADGPYDPADLIADRGEFLRLAGADREGRT